MKLRYERWVSGIGAWRFCLFLESQERCTLGSSVSPSLFTSCCAVKLSEILSKSYGIYDEDVRRCHFSWESESQLRYILFSSNVFSPSHFFTDLVQASASQSSSWELSYKVNVCLSSSRHCVMFAWLFSLFQFFGMKHCVDEIGRDRPAMRTRWFLRKEFHERRRCFLGYTIRCCIMPQSMCGVRYDELNFPLNREICARITCLSLTSLRRRWGWLLSQKSWKDDESVSFLSEAMAESARDESRDICTLLQWATK